MKVFVSYSKKDEGVYSTLCSTLDNENIARWEAESLDSGYSLANQLITAIEECDTCIFLATNTSINSPWCLAELGAFWGGGKKVIIFLADSQLSENELPPQFRGNLWAKSVPQLISGIRAPYWQTKIHGSHVLTYEINGLNSESCIYCVTYKMFEDPGIFRQSWNQDKKFIVPIVGNKLRLEKAQIRENLEDASYPYKFYLLADKKEKRKYINYLLDANCTVTGKGEQDEEDPKKWQIWFLLDGEPIHQDTTVATMLNHVLIPH